MNSTAVKTKRVVSGIRSTGNLHLGHLHGALKNWVDLQNRFECFFFAADWHCLTTHYYNALHLDKIILENIVEWLACGVNPSQSTIFVQSHVPEHAELHLLLSMITPISWLERVPTYKDQQQKLTHLDLSTYGFLGYPLLQTADVLIYKADYVPTGEDQVPHIEFSREVARRFNHIYGKEENFEEKLNQSINKLGKKNSNIYIKLKTEYQQQGKHESLDTAKELINHQNNLNITDKERLIGAIEGTGKSILPEPESLLTNFAKLPGLDGQKMSKSYNNDIKLREPIEQVEQKIKTMPTDPARVRRNDPGTPEKCPVWGMHQVYSDQNTKDWVQDGCRGAKIGCIDCKKVVSKAIVEELTPIQNRIAELERDKNYIKDIVHQGALKAREVARITLEEVRAAIGINY